MNGTTPAKQPGQFDFKGLARRISTWLSAISAGCQAAGVFFIASPPEWQGAFPAVLGFALLGAGIVAATLVPIATSFVQDIPGPGGSEGST